MNLFDCMATIENCALVWTFDVNVDDDAACLTEKVMMGCLFEIVAIFCSGYSEFLDNMVFFKDVKRVINSSS